MKNNRLNRALLSVVLALGLILSMGLSSFAASSDDGFIEITTPKSGTVYYKGEKLKYEFTSYDTWEYLYTRPAAFIRSRSSDKYYMDKVFDVIDTDDYDIITGSYNTKNLPVGKYSFIVAHFAYESYYDDADEIYSVSNNPILSVNFSVKKLKAPTNLKTLTGKRKVTISYTKATGAKKYFIYRSTSKTGTYKKIGSTTKLKYVDNTAKKGKRYYYKVKSYRNVRGAVYSSYSTPVKSGKVK